MSNKSNGSAFERTFAKKLADDGWWVHIMQQNHAGQPADIIAVKGSETVLIDCKDCKSDIFRYRRIEPNQRTAMRMFQQRGHFSAYFAFQASDGAIYMESYNLLMTAEASGYNEYEIKLGEPLEEWLEGYR